ncbi:MAG: S9 family peptidase [Candidatus Riflebacteria bacterium]|nr:S9 family peptidase [Candidatus Riflebacteria bacterium]
MSQLFTVDLQGGTPVQITHGTSAHRAPCWAPDGRRIACSRCRDGVGDYYVTDIWVMDADGSGAWRLTEDIGRATSPCWSPDGSAVACYGTARQDSTLGDPVVHVWVVPAGQGRPVQVTRDLDRGVMLHPRHLTTPPAIWSGDGTSLTFSVADAGNVHLVRTWLSDPRTTRIVGGDRHVVAYSASPPADRIAFVSSELFDPADLWVCDWAGTGQRRLTRVNESVTAGWLLPRVERRTFPGPHGGELDGWVWRPAVGDGSLPMLLDIHGGPHAFFGNVFVHGHFYRYVLACRGWAVLTLNSTGSGSYGSAFAGAIRGRWGEYDLPEQLAAVDALVAEGLADGRRLAITGYSYGGFMTAWTIAHTDRFRAAVVGGPVVDLDSFHGTSDIGWCFGAWELGGDVASNRERYGRLSPINLVERIVTPTLVVHGEADDRCPIGQGEELFVGLIAAGKAPAEMVRYPGSAHLFNVGGLPSHRVDYCRRTIDWVERHTLGGR